MQRLRGGVAALLWACAPAGEDDPAADAGAPETPGCDPDALAWTVWVANQTEGIDALFVLHPHDDGDAHLVATVPVGRAPHNLAFTPDGSALYVANLTSPVEPGFVSVVEVGAYEVVATVAAGVQPHGVAVTPDGRFAWVTNIGGDDVTVIDTTTNEPAGAAIPVGGGPAEVAFTPDGAKGYVSNGDDGTVSVVDAGVLRVTKTIATGRGSMGLAVSHDGRLVFESEPTDNRLSVIDTGSDTVVNALALAQPHSIALAGETLVITTSAEESLVLIDARSLSQVGAIPVPGRPQMVAVSPDCRRAYATLLDAAAVAVVDLGERRLLATIDLGEGSVHGIAVRREDP